MTGPLDLAELKRVAEERLRMLADGTEVTGLDHLPVVARANGVAFAADVRLVLQELADLREGLRPFSEKGECLADGRLLSHPNHKTVAIIVSKDDLRNAAALLHGDKANG